MDHVLLVTKKTT